MFSRIRETLRTRQLRFLAAVALLAFIALGMYEVPRAARGGQQAGPKDGDEDKLPPLAFHKVGRGDVLVTVEERGQIVSMDNAPIVCKVRNNERGVASTVRWAIEDGTTVKSGDKVAELDDAALRDQVRAQETVVAEKKALLEQGLKERELAGQQGKLEVEMAEDNVEVAEIDLKQAAEKDRQKMAIRLRQAKRAAQLAKIQADTHKEKAEAAVAPRKVAHDAELAKLADMKEQLAACVLTAPRDGTVVYSVAEQARFGFGSSAGVVAVGEPVRQGQVLMTIPDLRRFQVVTRIAEGLVGRLRPSGRGVKPARRQQASIAVDAFPGSGLKGYVQSVATKAEAQNWLSADVKVYAATVALAPDQRVADLRPGMSATVTIFVDERKNVLRVPAQAVLGIRGNQVCFVKDADGVASRPVLLGASNDVFVEVKGGLKEGEEVVLNPQALRSPRKVPGRGQGRLGPFGTADVLVRSVRPTGEEGLRRTRVELYGLTLADLARIEETVPGLALVAPSRSFPTEVYSPLTGRIDHLGRVVATTPVYGVVHGLDSQLADEGHRFLGDQDQERFAAVAVLGADVARQLFPRDEPLGQAVVLSGRLFRVVGVLRERPAAASPLNHDVCIPLASSRRLFGKKLALRTRGSIRVEEVDLTDVSLVLRDREQTPAVAAAVQGLLEHYHDKQDWQVIPSFVP
ncbi:MAG TPA: ABC transporter permease [Gemmataceae bacterium]|nr:ABC transporter permease [Gemmataceae bacterium]